MRATDGGEPPRTSVPIIATLNILRNDFTPVITSPSEVNIREDISTTETVIQITGRDDDTTVSRIFLKIKNESAFTRKNTH